MFSKTKKEIKLDIPYYSQWESAKLVDDILNKRISAKEDPNWKNSGAENLEEYELWAINICGMACIKMILKKELNIVIPLIEMAKLAVKYGCYIPKENVIDGLFYDPAVGFLKDQFNLDATVLRRLSISKIKKFVTSKNYVVVSVNPEIRDLSKPITKEKGGHLVLVTGYNDNQNTISIHNPSGYYNKSQQHHVVTIPQFKKYFAGRGMVVLSS